MSFIGILFIIIFVLFAVMITLVIYGFLTKNWKKAIISIVIFFAIVLLMYFGLLRFITSM